MKSFVKPAKIKGKVAAPSSKSVAQRVLLLSSLLDGPSKIEINSLCDDIEYCAKAVEALGSKVEYKDNSYFISPKQNLPRDTINCGESGTCFRMICSLCARFDKDINIHGEGSLVTRPMDMGVRPLQDLGAKVISQNGLLPLKICGPLKSGVANLDGSISSQFLSGLLIALPFCEGEFVVKVDNLKSKPYVALTLEVLKEAGVELHYSKDFSYFQVQGTQKVNGKNFKVEGDWSSIATLLVAGAVAGEISVDGAKPDSSQADKAVLEALKSAGADILWANDLIKVSGGKGLSGFKFNAEDCPDSIPALVALASSCNGQSVIEGAKRLTHKESDRASALCSEYAKVGGKVRVDGNFMIVDGTELGGGVVSSHADHRIAMSMAIAGLKSKNGIEIEGAEAVAKSYPSFFEDLEKVKIYE